MSKAIKLPIAQIPQGFLLSATKEFLNYSVALYVYRDEALDLPRPEPDTLRLVGYGTLIACGGLHGILTAHHVIHRSSPRLELGATAKDILAVIVSARDHLRLPMRNLYEIPIGVPKDEVSGPDMSMIVIPATEELSTLRAKKSFWPIDRNIDTLNQEFRTDWTLLCTVGVPAERHDVSFSESGIRIYTKMMGFFGAFDDSEVFRDGDFDYIDTKAKYSATNDLPGSFGGVSGGGLWALTPIAQNDGESFAIRTRALCGVAFYETEIADDQRFIRHHFVDSVYRVARSRISGY